MTSAALFSLQSPILFYLFFRIDPQFTSISIRYEFFIYFEWNIFISEYIQHSITWFWLTFLRTQKLYTFGWQDMPYVLYFACIHAYSIWGRKHIKPFNVHFIGEKKNNLFRVCFILSFFNMSRTLDKIYLIRMKYVAIHCSSSLALMYCAICLVFGCIANSDIFSSDFFRF